MYNKVISINRKDNSSMYGSRTVNYKLYTNNNLDSINIEKKMYFAK